MVEHCKRNRVGSPCLVQDVSPLWLVAVAPLLAACSATPSAAPPSASAAAPAATAPMSTAPNLTPGPLNTRSEAARGVGVLDCASSNLIVQGQRSPAAPTVGPVTLVALDYQFGQPDHLERAPFFQGWRYFKVVMIIQTGTQVTLMIPEGFRDVAALTYAAGSLGERALRGDHTTTFIACDAQPGSAPESQFAGGFAIRAPVCLPLQFSWSGRTEQLILSFEKIIC